MRSRKNQNRNTLNSIRITLLDWDPMDLFLIGQAGIEEYDEYIPGITKTLKQLKTVEELKQFLMEFAASEMGVSSCDSERTQTAAEKLLQLKIA